MARTLRYWNSHQLQTKGAKSGLLNSGTRSSPSFAGFIVMPSSLSPPYPHSWSLRVLQLVPIPEKPIESNIGRLGINPYADVLNNQEHGGTMLPPLVLIRATAWIGLETTSAIQRLSHAISMDDSASQGEAGVYWTAVEVPHSGRGEGKSEDMNQCPDRKGFNRALFPAHVQGGKGNHSCRQRRSIAINNARYPAFHW